MLYYMNKITDICINNMIKMKEKSLFVLGILGILGILGMWMILCVKINLFVYESLCCSLIVASLVCFKLINKQEKKYYSFRNLKN